MKVLLAAACAGILAGCTSAGQSETMLDGSLWAFEANSLVDVWVEAVGDDPITIEFQDGQVNGNAGCNTFFGRYEQNGSSLSIGELGMTFILCEGEIQHQEDVILQAFERVTGFEIEGDQLRLDTGGGSALIYRRLKNGARIIDYGGLHTYETCVEAGGNLSRAGRFCHIDGKGYPREAPD